MDAQTDTSPGLDVSYVPYDQAALFVASEPTYAEGGGTDGNPELQELQRYLANRLIEGPVEELRDRLGILLRDERYHDLSSKLSSVVTVRAMLDADDRDSDKSTFAFADCAEQYYRGILLQAQMLSCCIAFRLGSQTSRSKSRKRKAKQEQDRFAFMQDQMPVAIKRALLAMWISPMCSVAVTALDSKTPPAVVKALLSEWIESLERGLALFLALGFPVPLPDGLAKGLTTDELIPPERRMEIGQVWGKWMQGLGRTIESMGLLTAKASATRDTSTE